MGHFVGWRVWRRLTASRWALGIAMVALLCAGMLASGLGLASASHPAPGITPGTTPGNTTRTVLRGHLVPALKGARVLHAAAPERVLQLSIALAPRDQPALAALIAAQNDRHSALYHHYLTPAQYAQRFAPTQASVDAVVAYLRAQGLVVGSVASNHLLVRAAGSVSTVERAFDTQIDEFALAQRVVYAPAVDPSIPTPLATSVVSIAGLDDVALYRPRLLPATPQGQRPTSHVGSGPGGGYTPSELRAAYDMGPLISQASGAGQTVAIFELDGYATSDINTYLSYYNLGPARYSDVLVDSATNSAGAGAIEVELDMETVSAIAPGANQRIYIGPNTGSGVLDTYNRIVSDDVAKVVSTSWGECEQDEGNAFMQSLDSIFQQAAAQGQAIFAAAGDSGAYDCYPNQSSNSNSLAVDSPADDPNVVGVGGTTLNLTSGGGGNGSESVWSYSSQHEGGGGGLSVYFSRPAYQAGPGVQNGYSNGKREVPDVSADADPNTGYSIYCTAGTSCAGSTWFPVGGTSAAAPLWAGIAADTNQYLTAQSMPTLGSASAALYHAFNTPQPYAPYHDVTLGNNLYYPATSGYDQASGIGTPNVWNLAQDLAVAMPHFQSTPAAVETVTAPGVSPAAQTLTLADAGVGAMGWTLSSTLPSWLAVTDGQGHTISSGTIASGASQNLSLVFSIPASDPAQTYSTTLTFTAPHADNSPFSVPVTVVAAAVSKTWYFAEGYTGGSFTTYITLANPNAVAAHVTLTYYLQRSSTPATRVVTVSANSRATINIGQTIGSGANGDSVSTVVTSDQPVVAERPMYFTYNGPPGVVIPGGSDVLGATLLGTDYDFGYLDTTARHATYLTVLNQNTTDMTVSIRYFGASGGETDVQHVVPAKSRGTIYVPHDLPAAGTYSALVHLSEPGLVERPLYLVDGTTGHTGSADVIGVGQAQSSWYFAEGYTSATFSERYEVSNPCLPAGCGSTPTAQVTVTYLRSDGTSAADTATITPGAQHVFSANAKLGSAGVNNSAVVTAVDASHTGTPVPVLAERFISFRYSGPAGAHNACCINVPGASDVLGAAAPSNLFDFAEGYTGGQFSEWLTIENPDPSRTANVQITYLPQGGAAPVVRDYLVGPKSRYTINTNNVIGGQSFSMQVLSNVPIVAERPMYFNFNAGLGNQTGGSDIVGYQP